MPFVPHVTVATVIERMGRFLMVEELVEGKAVLNQPAGHLEADESLRDAAIRETLEETGWDIELTGVIGIYLYTAPSNGTTYQRICFAGQARRHRVDHPLDDGIIGPRWLTPDELDTLRGQWRSELVMTCIRDYLNGPAYPLDLIR